MGVSVCVCARDLACLCERVCVLVGGGRERVSEREREREERERERVSLKSVKSDSSVNFSQIKHYLNECSIQL